MSLSNEKWYYIIIFGCDPFSPHSEWVADNSIIHDYNLIKYGLYFVCTSAHKIIRIILSKFVRLFEHALFQCDEFAGVTITYTNKRTHRENMHRNNAAHVAQVQQQRIASYSFNVSIGLTVK